MGRIKPKSLKVITEKVFNEQGENFTTDFTENKVVVSNALNVQSKKLRNVIAGYATRLKKRELRNN